MPTVFLTEGSSLGLLPSNLSSSVSGALTVVGDSMGQVTSWITNNWILWLSLVFGILGFSISLFRRLRRKK